VILCDGAQEGNNAIAHVYNTTLLVASSPRRSVAWSGRFSATTAAGSSRSTQVVWNRVRVGGDKHQLKTYKTVFHFLLWG
jgi:hypothetical protein